MKIKTWLLFSYFIVMVLPLACAYFLFAWINAYYDDEKVGEHLQTWSQIQNMITILDNPNLFQRTSDHAILESLTNEETSIALYNPDGFVIYTSNEAIIPAKLLPSKEEIYENLYALQQGYRAYTYKQPVFSEGNIVGFFEIQISRKEWTNAVQERTWITIIAFLIIFLLIYVTVAVLVNRKLNKRLALLMDQMTAFAKDEKIEELPSGKDEIGELTKRFYEMKETIVKTQENLAKEQQEKEYMIATISHDLKTPLTSIRAYAESLAKEEQLTPKERKEYRNIIVDKANYMKQMLDDLLMYTLLQSTTYEMELIEVEGMEFFEMLVSDYDQVCKEKGISLNAFSKVYGKYMVNPKQMIRVADNLMSNALQHTKSGDSIGIGAFSNEKDIPAWVFPFVREKYDFTNNKAYLIVQNDGEGIAPESISRIFDPLYQVDEARSKKDARGTGLGLSITKRIVEMQNGKVEVLSASGVGTCVIIELPKKIECGADEKYVHGH
jgi:signal transduction histidine kinase